MTYAFIEALSEKVLLGDGAMGTQLQQSGLEPGGCGEAWNADAPARVLAIHQAYVEAGSDCLITNTFGGSRIMLERHGFGDRVSEINRAAAQLARQAFGERPGFVLGDIGPFGGLMEPYGEIKPEAVQSAFLEQAEALVAGGVDAIIIETQTSLEELEIAIEAARAAGARCVIGSVAFDVTLDGSEARTMMGVDPEAAAKFMAALGVDVIALNCGTGIDMEWAAKIAARYRNVCDSPLMAQPNAGTPSLEDMRVVYKQRPEEMASTCGAVLTAGVGVIGACCGSTPEHIRALRAKLDEYNREA